MNEKELKKLESYKNKLVELAEAYNKLAENINLQSRVAVIYTELDENQSIEDYSTPYASYIAGEDTGWFPSGLNC